MRRIVVLALLFGAMKLIEPLGGTPDQPAVLLTFGFLILVAYASGELLGSFGLPKLVGYLLGGVLAGPGVLKTVTTVSTVELEPVSSLAIAMIAFLAGAELRWDEIRLRGLTLLKLTVSEIAVTFVLITAFMLAARSFVPFLQDMPLPTQVLFAALFASIAVIHSPAVTMALLTETKARGPLARTTLGVVLVSDVVVVLLFSGMLALTQKLEPVAGATTTGPAVLLWEILGAIPIGAVLGLGIAQALRVVKGEMLLFALLAALFGQQIAALLHVEVLLTLLMAGFVAINTAEGDTGHILLEAVERAAAPVFVVFFALAGAKLDMAETISLAPLILPIAAVRILGIRSGLRLGATIARVPHQEVSKVWYGLVSQAGVAIGLVTIAANAYPHAGSSMRTILLSLIAVNETFGAILFRRALAAAGEIGGGNADAGEQHSPASAMEQATAASG